MKSYDNLWRITWQQTEVITEIKKLETNFNKDSEKRKTKNYLIERKQKLTNLYEEFIALDFKLRLEKQKRPDHPYWDIRKQTEEIYTKLYQSLKTRLQTLEAMENKLKPQNFKFNELKEILEEYNARKDQAESRSYFTNTEQFLTETWQAITKIHEEIIMITDNQDHDYFKTGEYKTLCHTDIQGNEYIQPT